MLEPPRETLPRFLEQYPEIKLDLLLFEYQTAAMLEKLQSGDIDVGVLALPVAIEGLQTRRGRHRTRPVSMNTRGAS